MTTATAMTVRQVIREHLAESDEADPHVIAKVIADGADDEMAREALREALVGMVRQEIMRDRRRVAPAGGKWAGYADALNLLFERRYSVGPEPHDWKFLGDFERADAEYVAAGYQARAAENQTHAERFEALAGKLTGGKTARDLGADVVGGLLDA